MTTFMHRLIPQVLAIPLQVVSIPRAKSIIQVALIHPRRSTILMVPLPLKEILLPNEQAHKFKPILLNTMLFLPMPLPQAVPIFLSALILQAGMLFPHRWIPQVLEIPLQVASTPQPCR